MENILEKEWYSAAELSFLRLPIFPSTRQGIQKKFVKEERPSRAVDGKRGGKSGTTIEYLLTSNELSVIQQTQISKQVVLTSNAEIAEIDRWLAENR